MQRTRALIAVPSFLLLALALPASAQLDYASADPEAPEITSATLYDNDRFWPYQVRLVAPIEANGRSLASGLQGVLIRVQPGGTARIDFGRDGIADVPLARTNIVSEANAVRTGIVHKVAPNFPYAVGPRLLDGAPDPARPVTLSTAAKFDGFITVFADPDDERLEQIADATRDLHARSDLMVVLFPQTEDPDTETRQRIRSIDWKVAFVYGFLAESYRASLAGDAELPLVSVHTNEGRLLFEQTWDAQTATALRKAVHVNFPSTAPNAIAAAD